MKLKIIKSSLILATALCLNACTSSPYYLVTNVENVNQSRNISGQMEGTHHAGGANGQAPYSYSSHTIANGLKPVFFPTDTLKDMGMRYVNQFVKSCESKSFSDAFSYIEKNKLSESRQSYLKAIVYMLQKKYEKSLSELENLDIESLDGSIELLKLDNTVELERKRHVLNYKNEALKAYQKLFDSGILNKDEVKILKNRVKHLQYV